MPTMDYTLLRGRIRDCGMTQKELAEKAGIMKGSSARSWPGILHSARRSTEFDFAGAFSPADIGRYFFLPKKL